MPLAQSMATHASIFTIYWNQLALAKGAFLEETIPLCFKTTKDAYRSVWQITVTIFEVLYVYVVPGKEQTDGECLLRDLYRQPDD
jgi:hypothetical protein